MAPLPAGAETGPVFFTAHPHQILSNCIQLLGVSVLSYCLAHRAPSLSSWKQWTNLAWGRLVVILVLIDSWLFIFFTGMLVNGVGLSFSRTTCALAIYACIGFYGSSKVLTYGFLVEKMYIVWSGGNQIPRFKSSTYRICTIVLLGYVAVLVLMVVGQNSRIRPDGLCIIGLKTYATVPLISYDLFLNVFLTAMFLWPLRRDNVMSPRLRNVATRTLYGACITLTISAANVAVLLALKGEEYGWVCLASCVADVALNAMALSWVTARSYSHHNITVDRFSLPTMDVGPLMLVKSDCEQGKENVPTTLQTTLPDAPSPMPGAPSPMIQSLYDYIPRDQRSENSVAASESTLSQGWVRRLRKTLGLVRDPASSTPITGAIGGVTQSSGLSATIGDPGSGTGPPCEQSNISTVGLGRRISIS